MGANNLSTTGSITLSYANPNSFLYCNSSKNLVSTATTTNGQILIGSTSAPATITGTTFQTIITKIDQIVYK